MYKDINRALILQNQELRQELHKLKEEIVALNSNLMVEKYAFRVLNQRHLKLLRDISKACNDAMHELNQSIEVPNDVNQSRLVNSQEKIVSRRSVRPVRPTLRQMQVDEYNKENASPSHEEVLEERTVSYVQTRRRWNDEPSAEVESESAQSARGDISTNTLDFDGAIEDAEGSADQSQDLDSRRMHTIREENTEELSLTCISRKSLSYSTLNHKSARQSSSIAPQKTSFTSQNTLLSQDNRTSPSDKVSQSLPSRASVPEKIANDEDTILANFRSMKAPCSTPYKANPNMIVRKCIVKIKRLAESDLIKAVDISEKNYHSTLRQNLTIKKGRRHNVFPGASYSRISSPRVSSHMSIDASPSFNKRKNSTRPKRTAAPSNLKEPKLTVKLRRNL